MKKINITLLFTILFMAASAQRNEPVNPQKDNLQFEGYTIKLLPAMGGTYGYVIIKGKELVVHQSYNPFTMSPLGLRNKEDAYKVAKWQILQIKEGRQTMPGMPATLQNRNIKLPPAVQQRLQMQGFRGPTVNQPLPKKVAEELQININY